jgi:hypothetical protein
MVSNSPQYIAVYNPENSATYYQICVPSEMVVQGFERPLGSDPAPPPRPKTDATVLFAFLSNIGKESAWPV